MDIIDCFWLGCSRWSDFPAGLSWRGDVASFRYRVLRKQYERADEASIVQSREYFGELLVEEVSARKQKRDWQQAIRGLLVLLRYYPKGFASVLRSR
jgi:hypothetical protein